MQSSSIAKRLRIRGALLQYLRNYYLSAISYINISEKVKTFCSPRKISYFVKWFKEINISKIFLKNPRNSAIWQHKFQPSFPSLLLTRYSTSSNPRQDILKSRLRSEANELCSPTIFLSLPPTHSDSRGKKRDKKKHNRVVTGGHCSSRSAVHTVCAAVLGFVCIALLFAHIQLQLSFRSSRFLKFANKHPAVSTLNSLDTCVDS